MAAGQTGDSVLQPVVAGLKLELATIQRLRMEEQLVLELLLSHVILKLVQLRHLHQPQFKR